MVGECIQMYDDENGSKTALLQRTFDTHKKKKKISEKNSLKLLNV